MTTVKKLSHLLLLLTAFSAQGQLVSYTFKEPEVKVNFGTGEIGDRSSGENPNYRFVPYSCPSDGHFTYASSTADCFRGDWHTLTEDHTPGDVDGNMMIVNSSYRPGVFMTTAINRLKPATTYEFSVWCMNICKPSDKCPYPLLPQVVMNLQSASGKVQAELSTGELTRKSSPEWTRYQVIFKTPAEEGPLTLTMVNIAPGGCGNDFVMDDINFSERIETKFALTTPAKTTPKTGVRKPAKTPEVVVKKTTPVPEKIVVKKIDPPVVKKADPPVVKKADPPVVKKADPPVVKKVDPPVVKKADPPVVKKAEPPVVKKADPPVVKKVDPPVTKKIDPPGVKKVDPPVVKKPDPAVVKNPTPKTSVAANKKTPAPVPVAVKKEPEITEVAKADGPAPAAEIILPKSKPPVFAPAPSILTSRANPLLKTIEADPGDIKLDLYDNGEIDGDTISVYHNNELVVSHARLTVNPITIHIKIDPEHPHHELVLVAHNLGSIPPNTSLMVINAGGKRYEVFISSTEQKNAKVVIDLKH